MESKNVLSRTEIEGSMKIIGANLNPSSPTYGDLTHGNNFGGLSNNNMRSTTLSK